MPASASRRTTRPRSAPRTRSPSTTRSCAARCCRGTCASSSTTSASGATTWRIFEVGNVHRARGDGAGRDHGPWPPAGRPPYPPARASPIAAARRGRCQGPPRVARRPPGEGRACATSPSATRRRRPPGPDRGGHRGAARRRADGAGSRRRAPPQLPGRLRRARRAGRAFAEIDLAGLARLVPTSGTSAASSTLPAVERDIAVVVDQHRSSRRGRGRHPRGRRPAAARRAALRPLPGRATGAARGQPCLPAAVRAASTGRSRMPTWRPWWGVVMALRDRLGARLRA